MKGIECGGNTVKIGEGLSETNQVGRGQLEVTSPTRTERHPFFLS